MNETYNKSDLMAHLALIKPTGFTLTSDGIFQKVETNRTVRIFCSVTTAFPHDVSFSSVTLDLTYPAVETIMNTVWNTVNSAGQRPHFDHDMAYSNTFNKFYGKNVLTEVVYDEMRDTEVFNDETFNQVRGHLETMINAALAFAAQYQTLTDCYNYCLSLPSDNDRYNFLVMPGSARYMIIKKLMNATDYASYAINVVNNFPSSHEAFPFLQETKNYLDAM